MERWTAPAVRLTESINVCWGNRIRKMCVVVCFCANLWMQIQGCLCWLQVPVCAHHFILTYPTEGQCKHVISFKTKDIITSFFSYLLISAIVCHVYTISREPWSLVPLNMIWIAHLSFNQGQGKVHRVVVLRICDKLNHTRCSHLFLMSLLSCKSLINTVDPSVLQKLNQKI